MYIDFFLQEFYHTNLKYSSLQAFFQPQNKVCYPQPFFLTSLNSFVRLYSTTETMHIKVKTTYSKTIPLILSDLLYICIVIKISEKNFLNALVQIYTGMYLYVMIK